MLPFEIPDDVDVEEKLVFYKKNYDELRNIVLELVKKNKDTEYIEILLNNFDPLLKAARINYSEEAMDKINELLSKILEEISELLEGSDFQNSLNLVSECYDLLKKEDLDLVEKKYLELNRYYKKLNKDFQKLLYRACLDINSKIISLKELQ